MSKYEHKDFETQFHNIEKQITLKNSATCDENFDQFWFRLCEFSFVEPWEQFISTGQELNKDRTTRILACGHDFENMDQYMMNFDFSNNKLGSAGINALCYLLERSQNIKSLNLHNSITNSSRWSDSHSNFVYKKLSNAIIKTDTLQSIDLSGCGIDNTNILCICRLINNCKKLKILKLSCNKIGMHVWNEKDKNDNKFEVAQYCPAMKAICHALAKNSCIHELYLDSNYIDSYGMSFLANALKTNSTVQFLNIANNPIALGAWGASQFADAIKHNTTLISLNIENWYDFIIMFIE